MVVAAIYPSSVPALVTVQNNVDVQLAGRKLKTRHTNIWGQRRTGYLSSEFALAFSFSCDQSVDWPAVNITAATKCVWTPPQIWCSHSRYSMDFNRQTKRKKKRERERRIQPCCSVQVGSWVTFISCFFLGYFCCFCFFFHSVKCMLIPK